MNKIIHGDSAEILRSLDSDSIDCLVTDPPYGYSFMGKDWDKAVPSVDLWRECLRVLKPGAFAFVMSAPRQDVLSQMIVRLGEAGFHTGFTSLYWTYSSGFPKAMNIGKMVDKRNGEANIAERFTAWMRTTGVTAKQLNDATGTFMGSHYLTPKSQPALPTSVLWRKIKPLITIEIPEWVDELIEREEAERDVIGLRYDGAGNVNKTGTLSDSLIKLNNEVRITAPATNAAKSLDGSYGGFQPKPAVEIIIVCMKPLSEKTFVDQALKNGKGITWLDEGRVPFEDGKTRFNGPATAKKGTFNCSFDNSYVGQEVDGRFPANLLVSNEVLGDYSKYFSLEKWAEKIPFLQVPKASKREKGEDCKHPTVKPLKLMSYLITLGSRPGDLILDPFVGSGTTAIAAKQLGRNYIGIEREEEYVEIAEARIKAVEQSMF